MAVFAIRVLLASRVAKRQQRLGQFHCLSGQTVDRCGVGCCGWCGSGLGALLEVIIFKL
ncbi:hypothetical protein Tco_1089867, partial [Tanacetum coccineum]